MTTQPQTRTLQPPVQKLRLGSLTADIWQQKTEKKNFYTVTFQRSYRDLDGNYQSTNRIPVDELPLHTKLSELAFDAVAKLRLADAA